MRKLYLIFQNVGPPAQQLIKGGAVPHQLTWTNLSIILPIKEESKRNYYINLCIKQNLSKRQLKEKIKNKEYERLEYNDDIEIITDDKSISIKDMIKNPILIKTNEKTDKLSEKALKQFILEKIEDFLLELGYGFLFGGSEYKLGKYKCDLLFFNTELNCYLVIELKIRKLKPIDIGQIKYYMNYIETNIKKDYMNKTIGIILCKEDDEIVVKYVTDERILFTTYELSK